MGSRVGKWLPFAFELDPRATSCRPDREEVMNVSVQAQTLLAPNLARIALDTSGQQLGLLAIWQLVE